MTIEAADLFCGAGGTSTGLYRACHSLGQAVDLLAINHWTIAIETHRANHPGARHICARLESILPEEVVPSGHLHLLVASPECTHHSIARGGRPVCDQLRASAWLILRWLEALRVDNLLIENVQEFRSWGPLGTNNRPLKSRKGETYRAFLNAISSFGYTIDDRILNAADYGDATTRRRLFILARRGKKKITWPEATHGAFAGNPYRTAREIIDWSIKGRSLSERKRPLSPNTMRRILAGIKKFGGESFIVHLRGTQDVQINGSARSIDNPLPTLTASGAHCGLCESFILPPLGYYQRNGEANKARSLDKPLQTITSRGAGHLIEPFLVRYQGNHGGKKDGDNRTYPLNKPIPTLDTSNRYALCEPFVIGQQSCGAPRSVSEPVPTIATKGAIALIEPFIIPFFGERNGQKSRSHSINEPLPAVTSHGAGGLVEPFLVKYNGTAGANSVDEPLDTVTTKDRFGLVEVSGKYQIDIRFRMLQPHELAAAMSFENYLFSGNKGDQVKQIGNAVPVRLAQALCRELLK